MLAVDYCIDVWSAVFTDNWLLMVIFSFGLKVLIYLIFGYFSGVFFHVSRGGFIRIFSVVFVLEFMGFRLLHIFITNYLYSLPFEITFNLKDGFWYYLSYIGFYYGLFFAISYSAYTYSIKKKG